MRLLNSKPNSSASSGIRSFVCDSNGIVIAETVYRCMVCADLFDDINGIENHYQHDHIEEKITLTSSNGYCSFPENFENNDDDSIEEVKIELEPSIHSNYSDNKLPEETKPKSFSLTEKTNLPTSSYPQNQQNKGGSVTCEVCGLTKYYSHISRRYGVFSCESCAKFFYRYSQKPVQYDCPNDHKCPLNIDVPGGRCKSCLLTACMKKYILDPKKHPKVFSELSEVFNTSQSDEKTFDGAFSKKNFLEEQTSLKLLNPKSNLISSEFVNIKNTFIKESVKSNSSKLGLSTKKRKYEEKNNDVRTRRISCKQCSGCLAEDCGECLYCLDKPKFGGNDVKKQKCLQRRCYTLQ